MRYFYAFAHLCLHFLHHRSYRPMMFCHIKNLEAKAGKPKFQVGDVVEVNDPLSSDWDTGSEPILYEVVREGIVSLGTEDWVYLCKTKKAEGLLFSQFNYKQVWLKKQDIS